MRNVFWGSMLIIESQYMVGGKWSALFLGKLCRLMQPKERLPFTGDRNREVWISAHATRTWLACVSWADKQDFRVSKDALPTLIGQDDYQLIIAECELAISVLSLLLWGGGVKNGPRRIIILCTDNINVSQWIESAKSHGWV